MDMLEWLEGYLLSYGGGILIVSHDRYFLDKVATGILELEHGKVTKYKGNYSRYIVQRTEQRKALERAYQKQQDHIRQTEEYIRKYKAGIKPSRPGAVSPSSTGWSASNWLLKRKRCISILRRQKNAAKRSSSSTISAAASATGSYLTTCPCCCAAASRRPSSGRTARARRRSCA